MKIINCVLRKDFFLLLKIQVLTMLGMKAEQHVPSTMNWLSSPLLTFLFAFCISSFQPSASPIPQWLERFAWNNLLQSALTLGIWGSKKSNRKSSKMQPMLVAFFLGSIGTLAGALIGYILSGAIVLPGALGSLRVCTACLSASYIGGTANFFEVGALLSQSPPCASAVASSSAVFSGTEMSAGSVSGTGLAVDMLHTVAAADIAVMCLYFAGLSVIQRNMALRRGFECPEQHLILQDVAAVEDGVGGSAVRDDVDTERGVTGDKRRGLWTAGRLVVTSLLLTGVSGKVQSVIPVSGVAVAVTTLLSLLTASAVIRGRDVAEKDGCLSSSRVSAEIMFSLFYATIGCGTSCQQILQLGAPLFLLVSVTLLVHMFFILAGSIVWNKACTAVHGLFRGDKEDDKASRSRLLSPWHIDLDTAVLASNACVGGASTAAAMAGCLSRPDLVLPATTAGILGSVIGTQTGLQLHRSLSLRLPLLRKF